MHCSCGCLGFKHLALAAVRPSAEPRCQLACPQPSPSLWTERSAPSTPLDLQGLLQMQLDPQDHAPGSLGPRCEVSAHTSGIETMALGSISSLRAACFPAVEVQQADQQHLRQG